MRSQEMAGKTLPVPSERIPEQVKGKTLTETMGRKSPLTPEEFGS